ncbi:succinyl-CoA synthetase (ADP-forming) beta subunit, alpha subunit [Desulfocurvibacter africanus PCS]|uniref:Succinyl-CoA synthetase (ADP-forming) beta subunit, alpha subunit n=1 Tax=Desulfocurvibacter africanus PCS TaxID=1262666 RepID=M5Q1M3_DESAF|nr:succinate--CoA ligase subunit alpha [Desulfocurvibacter africanus]EMG36678.1 succinyl-CoA synthetase (ADP-forming) beta subunit, alpha subunit [Desulfocurvibacter africanus PCS]
MLLDEQASKRLFREAGVSVPDGECVEPGSEDGFKPSFPPPWYLKAQVLTGGRGKAGGVLRVDDARALPDRARELFAKDIRGHRPPYLLLEPAVDFVCECYLSFAVSRDRAGLVLSVSPRGGVDVERSADALTQAILLPAGPAERNMRAAFFHLKVGKEYWPGFRELVLRLFDAVRQNSLQLAEINPLVLTRDGRWLALDGKAEIDDNAAALRPELDRWYDPRHHAPDDVRARDEGMSFVKLGGWVGCMVNGAGLAMATMDLLNLAGLPAANFLDLGGAADSRRLDRALRLLFEGQDVRVVFINLFGGILSCEKVAQALADVLAGNEPGKPLVVRMAGNGANEGQRLLEGLNLHGLTLVEDMTQALAVLEGFGPRDLNPPRIEAGDGRAAQIANLSPVLAAALRGATAGVYARSFDLDAQTRILVQGITGKVAALHTRLMFGYGSRIVAGVTPFKGGLEIEGAPVYDCVREALRHHEIDASIVFVPAAMAADAVLEAAEAGIPWVVCITEGIPQQDMLATLPKLRRLGTRLIGPNTPGIIVPGQTKIGIMPADPFTPGPVAIFSRSGTLTYEAAARLSAAGMGQALAVGIGGDPLIGLGFADCLAMVADDARVKAVLVLGEIGGRAEEDLAEYVSRTGFSKPMAAFIAGRTAPLGRRLGHAGAILEESSGGVAGKMQALSMAGIHLCPNLESIPRVMLGLLAAQRTRNVERARSASFQLHDG